MVHMAMLSDDAFAPLTRRQCGVIQMRANGMSKREIASETGLTFGSVKNIFYDTANRLHISYGACRTLKLILWCWRRGLVS